MSDVTREQCVGCDEPTGRAGRGEDSLYVADYGPLCEGCFDCITAFEARIPKGPYAAQSLAERDVQDDVRVVREALRDGFEFQEGGRTFVRTGEHAAIYHNAMAALDRIEKQEAGMVSVPSWKLQRCIEEMRDSGVAWGDDVLDMMDALLSSSWEPAALAPERRDVEPEKQESPREDRRFVTTATWPEIGSEKQEPRPEPKGHAEYDNNIYGDEREPTPRPEPCPAPMSVNELLEFAGHVQHQPAPCLTNEEWEAVASANQLLVIEALENLGTPQGKRASGCNVTIDALLSRSVPCEHAARVEALERELAEARSQHCRDCCCAASWKALGISEYTGKSIPEHITLLKSELAEAKAENERLRGKMREAADRIDALYAAPLACDFRLPDVADDLRLAASITNDGRAAMAEYRKGAKKP